MLDRCAAPVPAGSSLSEQPQLQRELNVVGAMCQAKFLLDPLFIRVDGLWTYEKSLADLGGGIALRHQSKHVALTLRELLEPLSLALRRILLREVLGEHACRRGTHVHISMRHGTHRVHEFTVGCTLHEIARRARFHERYEVVFLGVHREYEDPGRQTLLHDLLG